MTAERRIAWDGVALAVPANWEMARYRFLRGGVTRVELEDEYALRLEAEWTRAPRRLKDGRFMARYTAATESLTKRADRQAALEGLPPGWVGARFFFREVLPVRRAGRDLGIVAHELLTACFQAAGFAAFFVIHTLPQDRENPEEVIRCLAEKLDRHEAAPLVPWALFDLEVMLPREFVLEHTLFDIGAKLLQFRWRRRRFDLWCFSCADMFLGDGMRAEAWAADFLNRRGRFKAVEFSPGPSGEVFCRRKWRHPFGHSEEIGRWCFRYAARSRLDACKKQLMVWVFNYRRPEDLQIIPEALRDARISGR